MSRGLPSPLALVLLFLFDRSLSTLRVRCRRKSLECQRTRRSKEKGPRQTRQALVLRRRWRRRDWVGTKDLTRRVVEPRGEKEEKEGEEEEGEETEEEEEKEEEDDDEEVEEDER